MKRKRDAASIARGREIVRRRDELGLSQEQFAAKIKRAPSTLSRLENGQMVRASHQLLEDVAAGLNCTVDDLTARTPRSEPAELQAIVSRMRRKFGLSIWRQLELIGGVLVTDVRRSEAPPGEEGTEGGTEGGAEPHTEE